MTPKPVEPPTKTTGQELRPVPVSGRIHPVAPETARKPAVAPTGPAPKKTKLTAEDRRRQFELLTDGDKKALADQWFKPEMRAGAAAVTFADKESFEFVLSLAADKRKVLTIEEIKNRTAPDTQAAFATLTREDKLALGKLWGMDLARFNNAITGERQYQYVRRLPAEQVIVLTPTEIKNLADVSAEECRQRRQADLSKLTDQDRRDLRAGWRTLTVSEQCITAAFSSAQSYAFFIGLSQNHQRSADAALINGAKPPDDWGTYRRRKIATMTSKDWTIVSGQWGMDPGDDRVTAAKQDDKNYQYLCKLPPAVRVLVTKEDVQNRAQLSRDEIERRTKNRRTEVQAERTQSRRAGRRAAEAEGQRRADEQARIEAERHLARQAALTAARGKYPRLRPATIGRIFQELSAQDLVHELDQRANAAWLVQRSPENLDTWVRWMQLTLRPQFEDLTEVTIPCLDPRGQSDSVEAHISLDDESLRVPTVTDGMTPAELLDALLKPAPDGAAFANDVLHVTLDTWGRNAAGGRSLPHRYWRPIGDPVKRYETKTAGRPRWEEGRYDEDEVKLALDRAYDQMRERLLVRARRVLDDAGMTL